jgi:hypothetical protein
MLLAERINIKEIYSSERRLPDRRGEAGRKDLHYPKTGQGLQVPQSVANQRSNLLLFPGRLGRACFKLTPRRPPEAAFHPALAESH